VIIILIVITLILIVILIALVIYLKTHLPVVREKYCKFSAIYIFRKCL